MNNPRRLVQWKSIQMSEVSVLPLSEIANDPSILLNEGEMRNNNPLIHFDIEQPITPIEMCDVYCNSQMCDVYCIDAEERVIHGHIYDGIKEQRTQDNLTTGAQGAIVHGHIYGDVDSSGVRPQQVEGVARNYTNPDVEHCLKWCAVRGRGESECVERCEHAY
jgi:hypothetical protein